MDRVFIHGLESSSQGTKGSFFRKKYPEMIIEDFVGPLEQRMAKLNKILADKTDLILVGSSYGGTMATIYACNNEKKVKKLILLAPALNLTEFKPYLSNRLVIPVMVYHGLHDDVVPPGPVQDIARMLFANLTFHTVEDDHFLQKIFNTLDWDDLLCL
ncbi:MAG: alpha/beta fold hydrolase [Syntrophales bacterium]|nr:alpha/beta fold hydrolase [Syntrophales bacterium]